MFESRREDVYAQHPVPCA